MYYQSSQGKRGAAYAGKWLNIILVIVNVVVTTATMILIFNEYVCNQDPIQEEVMELEESEYLG